MPHVALDNALSDAQFHPGPVQLFIRDFQSQVTPNETQRNTLIVAGVYILAIGILWCVVVPLEAQNAVLKENCSLKAYTLFEPNP